MKNCLVRYFKWLLKCSKQYNQVYSQINHVFGDKFTLLVPFEESGQNYTCKKVMRLNKYFLKAKPVEHLILKKEIFETVVLIRKSIFIKI